MNKEELKKRVDKCFSFAERMLTETGSMVPMLDLYYIDMEDKPKKIGVVLAGDDKKKRDAFIRGLGVIFGMMTKLGKIKDVESVCIMSEAWGTSHQIGEDISKAPMPSQSPNRMELLMVSGLTPTGDCVFRAKEMISIEVKGKRHFSLKDLPVDQGKEATNAAESGMLQQFYDGLKHGLEPNAADGSPGEDLARSLSMEDLFAKSVESLARFVGSDSEIVNLKNKKS